MSPAGSRVLVVEDEKLLRWSLQERLSRKGYETVAVETGEEALAQLSERPFDAVLLDVRLPGIDGVEVLRRASSLQPGIAVVMMSAHSTVDVAVGAMKIGAHDFLVKPFALQALDEAVERALESARTRRAIAGLPAIEGTSGSPIIGTSASMVAVRSLVSRVAASDNATVLLEGESGSGKDVVSHAIHDASGRASKLFLQINCAAVPDQLLESELFGHERGSFTDAHSRKKGLFETAEGGTVLLDEIGEMPTGGQAKLLLLLERRRFRRVGGVEELATDVRVIAATNVDLDARVADGRFRADLFFRLNVLRIRIPPLRERPEDIAPLAAHFVAQFNQANGRKVRGLSPMALDKLRAWRWPGNVRELRNAIERAFILDPTAEELRVEHFPDDLSATATRVVTPLEGEGDPAVQGLEATERRMIAEAMRTSSGNQSRAARLLGISRDTLRYRLKKHGIGG